MAGEFFPMENTNDSKWLTARTPEEIAHGITAPWLYINNHDGLTKLVVAAIEVERAALTAANQRIAELEGELREAVELASQRSHEAIDRFRKARHEAAETAAASMRERCALVVEEALFTGEAAVHGLGLVKAIRALPLTAPPQGDDGGEPLAPTTPWLGG